VEAYRAVRCWEYNNTHCWKRSWFLVRGNALDVLATNFNWPERGEGAEGGFQFWLRWLKLTFFWDATPHSPREESGSRFLRAEVKSQNTLLSISHYSVICQQTVETAPWTWLTIARTDVVHEALCYKPQGSGFKIGWGEWISSIYLILPPH
jgi:hypothetical protein